MLPSVFLNPVSSGRVLRRLARKLRKDVIGTVVARRVETSVFMGDFLAVFWMMTEKDGKGTCDPLSVYQRSTGADFMGMLINIRAAVSM